MKLGIFEFCPRRPDLVVSGINGGLNAGINVLYSGTVAAAIEGAFFGITSIACSLEYNEHAKFARAAQIAGGIIEQILAQKDGPQLYNLNIPTAATSAAERSQGRADGRVALRREVHQAHRPRAGPTTGRPTTRRRGPRGTKPT